MRVYVCQRESVCESMRVSVNVCVCESMCVSVNVSVCESMCVRKCECACV